MWPTGTIPTPVSALRDMLASCPTWVAKGGVQARVHYPTVNPSGVLGTAEPMPAALIERVGQHRIAYAEGARALPAGELALHLYLDTTTFPGVSDCEAFGDALADELMQVQPGLLLNAISVGEASEVTPAALAANVAPIVTAYRSITLSIQFGITA